MSVKKLRLLVLLGVSGVVLFLSYGAGQASGQLAEAPTESKQFSSRQNSLPVKSPLFSPSNARTAAGQLIPVAQFFPAARCQQCHQDTHTAWSQSLHRNAAREPFYRESADILLKTKGIEFTRHCESCHTPVALFSGALTSTNPKAAAPFTKLDDEGVTCSVCHSITAATTNGTGSYTIRRPALLANEDGSPRFGNFMDEEILADIPGHKRAVMRPLLKQAEFCATCHKVDAPPALNGYKHIRGFSAYDEWQQSGASQESVLPFYPRGERADCRACHMPKVESLNDRAAKSIGSQVASLGNPLSQLATQNPKSETMKVIASHRWLGANTAAPLFYGQQAQVAATTQFLAQEVMDVDIFALRRNAAGQIVPLGSSSPAAQTQKLSLLPGEDVTVEVVVSNRQAAHSFPPEVRDLYEAWVEFEALDATGKPLFHSGFLQPDGRLEESAHVYKQIILDEQGRQITRHQIWTTNIKAYDNTIAPGRSDVVRYRFCLPPDFAGEVTLRARLNYRRFNQEYTNYVLTRQQRQFTLPVVKMAESTFQLRAGEQTFSALAKPTPEWKRWNDYGIGLLEQFQYGAAAQAFRQAAARNPTDPNLLVNIALAEMGTERFGPELTQFNQAEALLTTALQLAPNHARTRYYRAQVWRAQGRVTEAAEELRQLLAAYPRDREVQRQYGQTVLALGMMPAARQAFESILNIDPTDFLAWQFLASVYAGENRAQDSAYAQQMYLQWRDDPMADPSAARFYAAHPEWADERIRAHVHGQNSTGRPVLTGRQAVPDK